MHIFVACFLQKPIPRGEGGCLQQRIKQVEKETAATRLCGVPHRVVNAKFEADRRQEESFRSVVFCDFCCKGLLSDTWYFIERHQQGHFLWKRRRIPNYSITKTNICSISADMPHEVRTFNLMDRKEIGIQNSWKIRRHAVYIGLGKINPTCAVEEAQHTTSMSFRAHRSHARLFHAFVALCKPL